MIAKQNKLSEEFMEKCYNHKEIVINIFVDIELKERARLLKETKVTKKVNSKT
jgi:hypothetical protein